MYCSSIFDYTDKSQVPERAIKGGTGFDVKIKLPQEIEACDYDYSIYPKCDYSIVWFSRGCIRNCPFCVVSEKEGKIKAVIPKKLNPNGKYIVVQDNNFFARPLWKECVEQLEKWNQPVAFMGIDIRLINDAQGLALKFIDHQKKIKIAWDNPKDDIVPQIQKLTKWIKSYKIMCYVLIGYWSTPEQDLHRVLTLAELGIDPFVMPYKKNDPYQKHFARWVNRFVYKSCSWEDYKYNPKNKSVKSVSK